MSIDYVDNNYLLLQFRDRIYSKQGIEYQSFFENIMDKAFTDFQKIRPYGNQGDGGNDGYRKRSGIYYQVYAPNTPQIKESQAAKKFKKDFITLKNEWDGISEIKEYNFVFNDKYCGSIQLLEKTISELEKKNPNIQFNLYLAKNLERLFFTLDKSDILNLGFDIDSRRALSNAYEYLKKVEIELDRGIAKYALKILKDSKDIIEDFNDKTLSLEYEILECRCLNKLEKVDEAKKKYKSITTRYPNDPRAFLYLAEIFLLDNNFDKNMELLNKAEDIDSKHWLLKLEKLLRSIYLEERINIDNINEDIYSNNKKIKALFFRLYAVIFEKYGNTSKADSFIEQAIRLNPEKFDIYLTRLFFVENRIPSDNKSEMITEYHKLFKEIKNIEEKFYQYGDIGARNKVILNLKKLNIFIVKENYSELKKIAKEIFRLLLTCYFNTQIQHILANILKNIRLSDDEFNLLLEHIENSQKESLEELLKVLILQFNERNNLFTEGKYFFRKIEKQSYCDFINNIECKNINEVYSFLKNDIEFAVSFVITMKELPEFRRCIIERLPDNKTIQKDKLLLLTYYDEKKFSEAFEILKRVNLKKLNYYEAKVALEITKEKKAWDSMAIVLEKLLKREKNEKEKFFLKHYLFKTYINLEKYREAIKIGEEVLRQDSENNYLKDGNKEILLFNTIFACIERGKIDKNALRKAKDILNEYRLVKPSYKFKIAIETEVYLVNKQPQKALNSIIEAVKLKKVLTANEYAELYYTLFIRIGNVIDLKLDSLNKVKENTFVKLKNKEHWYLIGDSNELDAKKITKTNSYYTIFKDKKVGDKIVFENKYSSENSEETIEKIYTIKEYILWKSLNNFVDISKDNFVNYVQRVEIPEKEGNLDTRYLKKFMEDQNKKEDSFFEMYCKSNLPIALLAVNEGGLTNAIGRIQQENKGFINFSTGKIEEFEKQKEIAKRVIEKDESFYIDGTSATILSEAGLIKKIYTYIPNLRIPQSVITLLVNITEKIEYTPGQVGYMGYINDKITFSKLEKEKRTSILNNFLESIKVFEKQPKNVSVISLANKADRFSEQKIPPELCDACILAQNENLPVLTEDYLYLKLNELETKKTAPEYFSSFALLMTLYEKGKISFNEYLNFFSYLTSYRFKFLPLSSDDIKKAVFGDENKIDCKPKNIKKLNLSLTLSEEYGVSFNEAFRIVEIFLIKVLQNNAVSIETMEKIFIEITEAFPTKMSQKNLGQILLRICFKVMENNNSKFILHSGKQLMYKKAIRLIKLVESFD
ncbi:MAG: hypothetical protein FH753_14795 [Firmicutes bacterium]|nr:hypothetical protein [Bacillota bacterium]